jgi:DNA ligase 1
MNKTLFGKDKNGNIKVWHISTSGNILSITHGRNGGKLQEKQEIISGKNSGRSNATTDSEQCVLEAESRYKKQLDKGYRERIEDLDDVPLLAMLALDYHKCGHRMQFPLIITPKLDGNRMIASKKNGIVSLQSRMGKPMSVPHIEQELANIMGEGMVLDGEIYIHNTPLEHIVSAVRTPSNPLHKDLEYWVFDVVVFNTKYIDRLKMLEAFVDKVVMESDSPHLLFVNYAIANEMYDICYHHDMFKEQGFEGVMLRTYDGLYEPGKRSSGLQKYKLMEDAEFRIVGVSEDRNGNAVLTCFSEEANNTFNVTYGSFDERKRQLEYPHEYIGKWLTVAYQTLYEDSGLPQFPVGKAIRECDASGTPLE